LAEQQRVELSEAFPHRGSAQGPNGCVAADHTLATGAGYRVMVEGGSAADMVVAMAAVMTVVQPHYSHLGGDAFALTYRAADRSVAALNSSGPAPAAYDVQAVRARGALPEEGATAVTVPGCVGGWWELHREQGRLPWKSLFTEAVALARDGFPATRGLARAVGYWPERGMPSEYFTATFGHVTGDGGQRVVQPALARTLEAIAHGGADGFYSGDVARACLATLREDGGAHQREDWRSPARWVEPLRVPFQGTHVYTQPPQSRGLVLALALQDFERRLTDGAGSIPAAQFEALESAFATVNTHAGDPDITGFDAHALLKEATRAAQPRTAVRADGDTTYLLALDRDGNAVSFIQSVFAPWGSALWAAEAGVLFNNRAFGFTLQDGHLNDIAPGKRPMHTLHCYLATNADDGRLRVVGGAPGAHRQPTTNLQLLDALIRRDTDPQDALDQPRWAVGFGHDRRTVELEMRPGSQLPAAFEAAGIAVEPFAGWDGKMGRASIAKVHDGGVAVGSDLRGEGTALVF
jgi:gamma-glutamyltranspeptidase / glutathione hydrolase